MIFIFSLLLITSLSADMQLAPNGEYVNGQPQLTPDGDWVMEGTIILTPEGKYIAIRKLPYCQQTKQQSHSISFYNPKQAIKNGY